MSCKISWKAIDKLFGMDKGGVGRGDLGTVIDELFGMDKGGVGRGDFVTLIYVG